MNAPGIISAFRFGAGGKATVADVTDLGSADGFIWLHCNLSDQRVHGVLRQIDGLDDEMREILTGADDHQHIERLSIGLAGVLADFSQEFDADSDDSARLRFVLMPRLLITARHRAVQSVEHLRQRLPQVQIGSAAELLAEILAYFPKRADSIADRLGDELEIIEDRVLDDRFFDERARIAPLRQLSARLHRLVRGFRRAILRLERISGPLRDEELPTSALKEALDLAYTQLDEINERARLLHDETAAKIASETNRILFILSALTAIFLPPAFVAGLFGMNFTWMPFTHENWGFWFALAVCGGSSVAVWLFLQQLGKR